VAELRWILVVLQLLLLVGFWTLAREPVVVGILGVLSSGTALSNLLLLRARPVSSSGADRIVGAVLMLDVAALTVLLAVTGGPDNPFAILYVLPVSTAAMVGGRRLAWLIAAVAVVGYAAQFRWHLDLALWHQMWAGLHVHLLGMWISVLLVAVTIAFLAQRLHAAFARHERVLDQARRRLERTDQLAWLTSFAAGAAHDLGSPLATMAVAAREIERRSQAVGDDGLAEEARMIRDEVDRCGQILDRMAAGLDPGLEEPDRPDSITDLTVLLAADLRGEMERVEIRAEDGLHELPVRAQRLAQLLLPLIRNGLRASPPEGRVEIRLASDAGSLRAEIIDHGEGMAPEILARATEPFFTTRPRGESSGLGLHIVGVVAEAMGGSLTLSSQLRAGTTVSLVLPFIAPAARVAPNAATAPAASGASGKPAMPDTPNTPDAPAGPAGPARRTVRAGGLGAEAS
jgi:two-component system sensor histidine kinase RegB